ncbi:peptidase M3 [Komagataeibacter nataicola]|uniref:M3 family oligoendopeptidase n=1 Tax=Komagataeibacter nataicola TaxID=265960 RepID=A0A9N7GZX5_9PROT|nr:M3 family oligoendopeptidase [Komagataeibacter nataicola]AQU86832.1 peptidase M3 [Komagataeibacter nataicola]PYD67851.1 M3 family oligoendopeptidase [Komagataeibacter nataicola]WEQ56217.1 M3 family oligoendopeptidase [Komagataeibacter nataicola]WNM07800.1 M3 family oligoendopeptidase [Komagataeibacter nataicola]GBR24280.1 oligoendopeptidase F [Komagataeibacter nataicola NRIC 0616]
MARPFDSLAFPRPARDALALRFGQVSTLLDQGRVADAACLFDTIRRDYESWSALVDLRFAQDTTSPTAKADRDYADGLGPYVTAHEVTLKRRLLEYPDPTAVAQVVTPHTLELWRTDITTFDPRIADALEEEARLSGEYTALLASARVEIGGQQVNLSGLAPYAESTDRAVRQQAEHLRWAFFAKNAPRLDTLFDDMVHLRHGMARTLGYDSYIPLAYRRMRRVDYGPADVARFRDDVQAHVVPLVHDIVQKRAATMGWEVLYSWDEPLIDPLGNPRPAGGHDLLMARAQTMFERMGGDLGSFFAQMRENGYLDLINRPGKAGGGFCTSFPTVGMPFIFANFNGTQHDINVFTHEMGHAYQNWKSRNLPAIDLLWPTMDAAEINSMALEFLTWPHIDLMVEPGQGERYRRMHLISSLAFLPYGVCVDHFQHEVYARPDMTPAERHGVWRELEQRYLPWRDYGGLPHPTMGGRWQAQGHIYRSPFYYIDYALALCCAMQFWIRSHDDAPGALKAYVDLCAQGGAQPFTRLVRSAGLQSPFQPGTLADVVRTARALLDD